ncbi:MAG: carbon-nitrogen hydrolase family protein, partial [Gemmatimonadota bacterium]|nr:carbon-nitrogen hydrolase family protein [Gemmatimonadota bacterium]
GPSPSVPPPNAPVPPVPPPAPTDPGGRPAGRSGAAAGGAVRVCAVQLAPVLGDPDANADRIAREMEAAAEAGAALAVFPEASLSGYVFASRAEAADAAVTEDSAPFRRVEEASRDLGLHAVFGGVERDGARLFNTAWLTGPGGPPRRYRKLHTLCLGLDRFIAPGDLALRPWDLPWGRIGVHICYDGTFPETARALKLGGAQLLVLITNWPLLALKREQVRIRALENHVFHLAVNRVGTERGVTFPGGSLAAGPRGELLAEAGGGEERFLLDLDLPDADENHVVVRPGEYEFDYVADRRPDAYGALVEGPPTGRPTGGRQAG